MNNLLQKLFKHLFFMIIVCEKDFPTLVVDVLSFRTLKSSKLLKVSIICDFHW